MRPGLKQPDVIISIIPPSCVSLCTCRLDCQPVCVCVCRWLDVSVGGLIADSVTDIGLLSIITRCHGLNSLTVSRLSMVIFYRTTHLHSAVSLTRTVQCVFDNCKSISHTRFPYLCFYTTWIFTYLLKYSNSLSLPIFPSTILDY